MRCCLSFPPRRSPNDICPVSAPVCLRRANIDTFDAPNDYTVIVRALDGTKYKLALMGPCINLSYRMSLGLKTPGGTMGLSCIGIGDSIIDRDHITGRAT